MQKYFLFPGMQQYNVELRSSKLMANPLIWTNQSERKATHLRVTLQQPDISIGTHVENSSSLVRRVTPEQ